MRYEQALIAAGTLPEHAAALAQREELWLIENRSHPNYGRQYEAEQIADATPSTDYYERG